MCIRKARKNGCNKEFSQKNDKDTQKMLKNPKNCDILYKYIIKLKLS